MVRSTRASLRIVARTSDERSLALDSVLQYLQHGAFVVRDTEQRDIVARVQFSAAVSVVEMFALHENVAPR